MIRPAWAGSPFGGPRRRGPGARAGASAAGHAGVEISSPPGLPVVAFRVIPPTIWGSGIQGIRVRSRPTASTLPGASSHLDCLRDPVFNIGPWSNAVLCPMVSTTVGTARASRGVGVTSLSAERRRAPADWSSRFGGSLGSNLSARTSHHAGLSSPSDPRPPPAGALLRHLRADTGASAGKLPSPVAQLTVRTGHSGRLVTFDETLPNSSPRS